MYIKKSDINWAKKIAKKYNILHILPETILLHLLEKDDFKKYVKTISPSCNFDKLTKELIKIHTDYAKTKDDPIPSYNFEVVLKQAMSHSFLQNNTCDIPYSEFLISLGVNMDDTFHNMLTNNGLVLNLNTIEQMKDMEDIMNKTNSPVDEVEFAKHTVNLNEEIKKNPATFVRSVGTDEQLKEMERTFLRKQKNSIIITGEPGVGKSNIVETFVMNINKGEVHSEIKNLKVFSLSLSSLLSDIKYHGILEARVNSIINVLMANPDYVLFIDEIHMINGAGGSNSNGDIMNFLKAPLSKNKIKVIGATTTQEYNKFIAKNPAFQRRFSNIIVKEPTNAETVEILKKRLNEFVKYHGVKVPVPVIEELVNLTNIYIKNRFNPDKSIDLLDSMMARKRLYGQTEATMSDVFYEISRECRIPSDEISITKLDQLEKLHSSLNERIIGQGSAFDELRDILMVSMAGLRDKQKTLGNFLFQGMTSSGKTETAKLIAENLGIPLIRYDMSAFQERHTVNTLIGSPPGYLGFGESAGNGKLINDIENNPNCVLLLDEIEKAHPDVLTILLQIMDYGKLSSSSGKDVYFNKVILVMTSNLGSKDAEKRSIGFGNTDKSTLVIDNAINNHLAPEFRSRLDSIIRFVPLSMANMENIVELQISDLNKSLQDKRINLELTIEAVKKIAKDSYESKLGARNVQNIIAKDIKTKLAKLILSGKNQKQINKRIVVNENGIDIV